MPAMHPNAQLIERFYQAFAQRDATGMAACYTDDVKFSDPVFPDLQGPRAKAMWKMLCERGKDLKVEYRDVVADQGAGRAHWDATYTFSGTGRKVINRIDAAFQFRDGLICAHQDTFDFWAWSRQALGLPGALLGWSPMLKSKVRKTAAAGLERFEAAT